ncbi:MAG: DUF4172 domain-containing protein [Deltaproteobacteria bacterium]|jgi:hypothetical protein|nr:DUF4172 domain-containing protein [Deltaproteobacteria bacterium]
MGLDPGRYIFNQPTWPKFRWDATALAPDLALLAAEEKLLTNKLVYLDPVFLAELFRVALYEELFNSFYLDDEFLDPSPVKEVLAYKSLAFSDSLAKITLKDWGSGSDQTLVQNYLNIFLDARTNPERRLSTKKLDRWRLGLSHSGNLVGLGSYRPGVYGLSPVSPGPIAYAKEPCPAPEAARLPREMGRFLNWHNAPWPFDPVIKAGIAHLWFLIVKPFLGASGRLARLTTELILNDRGPLAGYYSLSRFIREDRVAYHEALLKTIMEPSLDITAWLRWFVKILRQAASAANGRFDMIINKAVHWAKATDYPLSEGQRNILALLGADFIGPLSTERYAKLAKCDLTRAERELNQLVSRDLVAPEFFAQRA